MARSHFPGFAATSGFLLLTLLSLASCQPGRGDLALADRPAMALSLGHKRLYLWRACSPAEQRLGLKRAEADHLRPDASGKAGGMVFVYPGDRIASFSMRDMAFDLDLALFDVRGQLLHTVTLPAGDGPVYRWPEPVRYAVETLAGTLRDAKMAVGQQVLDKETTASLRRLCLRS